ncbi:MAG: hypothetical protein MUO21_10005, partial [Nitrososphaeraceae archaeon]|nr:hypothetical protein [Nitrososphaeraceae archaeon]
MQPNQLSDSLKNSVCKAKRYSSSSCPYYKLSQEIERLYKANKNSIPVTFWKEICNFDIPCSHNNYGTFYKSYVMASEFILFSDNEYEKMGRILTGYYYDDATSLFTNQLQRPDFIGFPLIILEFTRGSLTFIVDKCLPKMNVNISVDKILYYIIKNIDRFHMDTSKYPSKPTNVIKFILDNIGALDKHNNDIFNLVCTKFSILYSVFDEMVSMGFSVDGKCLELMLKNGYTAGVKKLLGMNIPIT